MLTDISHSDLKAESEYLSLLISSLDEPSDSNMNSVTNSQLASYDVVSSFATCPSIPRPRL